MNKIRNISLGIISTHKRCLSTSCYLSCKRHFDRFPLYEKRLNPREKAILRTRRGREENKDVLEFIDRGIRPTTMLNKETNQFETVQEMVPEIIVPDLTGFELKPYVSYRVPDVEQPEFTPQDLFQAVYSKKIVQDFEAGKLDEDGNPLEPSEDELLSCEEAKNLARKCGSDLFEQSYFEDPMKV